jgi:hypothetical protein
MNERNHWNEYQHAYEDTIQNTATTLSPWYVVPADNKWFTRVVVAAAVIETLASLNLAYPRLDNERIKEIKTAKKRATRFEITVDAADPTKASKADDRSAAPLP